MTDKDEDTKGEIPWGYILTGLFLGSMLMWIGTGLTTEPCQEITEYGNVSVIWNGEYEKVSATICTPEGICKSEFIITGEVISVDEKMYIQYKGAGK